MSVFSATDYKSYLDTCIQLITKRSFLCTQIMDSLHGYDYWTYNYACYLHSLNLEELNYLGYLFGRKIIKVYEVENLDYFRKYLNAINLCGLDVTLPQFVPFQFRSVTEELNSLIEQFLLLSEGYPELNSSPSK